MAFRGALQGVASQIAVCQRCAWFESKLPTTYPLQSAHTHVVIIGPVAMACIQVECLFRNHNCQKDLDEHDSYARLERSVGTWKCAKNVDQHHPDASRGDSCSAAAVSMVNGDQGPMQSFADLTFSKSHDTSWLCMLCACVVLCRIRR